MNDRYVGAAMLIGLGVIMALAVWDGASAVLVVAAALAVLAAIS